MVEDTGKDLRAMINLLEKDGSRWAQLFQKALMAYEQGDYYRCGEIILSASGGLGSLNDVVLGQTTDQDGNFQWKAGYEEMNCSYQELLSSLYAFARERRQAANQSNL